MSLQVSTLYADVTITIKGDVYGGGKQGAVGIDYTTDKDAAKADVDINVDLTDPNTKSTTNIEIYDGSVRTVFGGGENGRTFGNTSITVADSAMVGDTTWIGTIHGGLFGAGDGESAFVFGHSHVEILGGTLAQNVYGGGNKADLMGTTNVKLQGGDIQGTVYGGARVANIFGYSLVNIDGQNATNDLIIGAVYGGNDIAGNIKLPDDDNNNWDWITDPTKLHLPDVLSSTATSTATGGYGIDKTWNAFVYSSAISQNSNNRVYVGQLFGGGNGDYHYEEITGGYTMSQLRDSVYDSSNDTWTVSDYTFTIQRKPEVSKVYLELNGGNYGYVYGGGNQATVTEETVICLNNNTEDLYTFTAEKLRGIGINLDVDTAAYTRTTSNDTLFATPKYQFDRVFGGNKLADMDIHPQWHLENARINALYSGGDAGNMTYKDGLLLALTNSNLEVKNVYGGCRRADVIPKDKQTGQEVIPGALEYPKNVGTYKFNPGYSAHILITAGNIGNVYGGNDISGIVKGGNAIEIRSNISGNVYGGGNGSYVYTDMESLETNPTYGDFYYGNYSDQQNSASIDALNNFRPHTSRSYIHVAGSAGSVTHIPTVYGGGNSATVTDSIMLVLGEYTEIDNVFLGSNGIDMVNKEADGTLDLYTRISNLDLTDSLIFNTYMQGAAVSCMPAYTFDDSYPETYNASEDSRYAHIGSFYCGGNVGSMTSAKSFNIEFRKPIIITNKLVGGCNNAFVDATAGLNARNEGGFTEASTSGDKIHLLIRGVQFANPEGADKGDQGNIFGGCFNSGIVNGNVVIDLMQDIIPASSSISSAMTAYLANKDSLFNTPFSVFGGGFGPEATIIGNTTINITGSGRALKVFGGGLKGGIQGNTTINLRAGNIGKIYGGGFEGLVTGNTAVYLTGGQVYDSFGGACNANILGYTQTFVGSTTGSAKVNNSVFGGNDFGGSILGEGDFLDRIDSSDRTMVYLAEGETTPSVTKAAAYVEYVQGQITNYLFGGSCGNYNYSNENYLEHKLSPNPYPYLANAFVNFKPNTSSSNTVSRIFGAGQGYDGESVTDSEQDKMQDRSYVFVDIPDNNYNNFANTDVFGAGAYSGLGMGVDPESDGFDVESVSAVVDLAHGKLSNVYGGSYEQGITRRTVVNVPTNSTIYASNLFGGSYGIRNSAPCDVIESNVNYWSNSATVNESVYGGNNNKRRTLYARVNIHATVKNSSGWNSAIFGAGNGEGTWAQYTEINLFDGAGVYNVYAGGNNGKVLNLESVEAWNTYIPDASENANTATATVYKALGTYYTDKGLDDTLLVNYHIVNGDTIRTNTNINIYEGATGGYCYGAGLGDSAIVSGSTFLGLFGGTLTRDMYASGSKGSVINKDNLDFTAQTWAYVESGTVRNVYGGGWKGSVGYHNETTAATTNDVLGVSNVVVGKIDGTGYNDGIPAVQRNVYGGGEGGSIYGTTNVTINNGYVGFKYDGNKYVENLDDKVEDDNALLLSGNVFGGGYVINSLVDSTNVKIYGGTVRGSLYGGGEVGPIGRGNVDNTQTGATPFMNGPAKIYKAGHTHVEMYGGLVMRNVFGGGRGIDSWQGDGSMFMDQMMSAQEIRDCDWSCKGYVFGQTEVFIRGGVVGTPENVALGYGNVFGGGDLGFVYSGSSKRAETGDAGLKSSSEEGYYYEHNGSQFIAYGSENKLTDDSRVIVEPYAIVVRDGVTIGDSTFAVGHYVPTDYLDQLKNKNSDSARWSKISLDGIIIRNAVFAGGNVSSGSDVVYANTNTVLGNATATLRDVYNRDLITIGTEHTGGLYGDGNLTLVDGYRELNITNYGTDYFSQPDVITLTEYKKMTDREKAYYELKYRCITRYTKDGHEYTVGSSLTAEEYHDQVAGTADTLKWEESGFVSIYAGRLLNTIQRADFCGIFGSRMVLQGARDRVPEIVDYTDYTINRVGEVSLNQMSSQAGDTDDTHKQHGNYFGIYSVVNHMGALTSDVNFYDDTRLWDNADSTTYAPTAQNQTYFQWKDKYYNQRKRNNGTSSNKVALASGVFLELTTEESTPQNKDWGIITGVVELDLINVMTGLGGGYVYAKNVHGKRKETGLQHTILSQYNEKLDNVHERAITNKAFEYIETDDSLKEIQTSGNFIHPWKQIVDDCYPSMASYHAGGSPAHYWYIKGSIYVYDQYISAYTGSANSYAESVNIPLTITAQSHGKLQLKDVQPNLYAFYSNSEQTRNLRDHDEGVFINNVTYHLNDTISYWDWFLLSEPDQKKFVPQTYTAIANCTIGNNTYSKGYTLLPDEYEQLKAQVIASRDSVHNDDSGTNVEFDYIFRLSNNLGHNTGFILTYQMNNPEIWDKYYTPKSTTNSTQELTTKEFNHLTSGQVNYIEAPTYRVTQDGVYGQRLYNVDDIIPGNIHNTYEALGANKPQDDQATVERAFVVTSKITTESLQLNPGAATYKSQFASDSEWAQVLSKLDSAYICTSTLDLGNNEYIYYGELIPKARYDTLIRVEEYKDYFDVAWYCTDPGYYGGDYYEVGKNYRGLETWSSMSKEDREYFKFNYDALDLLIDTVFHKNQTRYYDSEEGDTSILYSRTQPIDYIAIYNGSLARTYTNDSNVQVTINPEDTLTREAYEAIPNEQYHYAPFMVEQPGRYYLVNNGFTRGGAYISAGKTITSEVWESLNDDQKVCVDTITFTASQAGKGKTYYFCRDSYVVNEHGEGQSVTSVAGKYSGNTIAMQGTVPVGFILDADSYEDLINLQTDFTVQGDAPIGTSTLLVTRESDIFNLSKGRVITVIYQYDYEESDETGTHIEPISEQHIVNIHINFKSGIPYIDELSQPSIVLPGSTVGLKIPNVTPGAYEILGSGWEMFKDAADADQHKNGIEYTNNKTPMYWYQDGYLVAYYTKTYLGKTYSNAVPFSVANYHRMSDVMTSKHTQTFYDQDREFYDSILYDYMYLDEAVREEKRNPKVYIRDVAELDQFNTFFGMIQGVSDDSEFADIANGKRLDFIIDGDIDHSESTWTSIGQTNCFMGNLHGDGHTISGLDNSLFKSLCGTVYNLGVTGSFTGSGIADAGGGRAVNCWVMTTGNVSDQTAPIIGGDEGLVENSYYYNDYDNTVHTDAYQRDMKAFMNGEVAYNLNLYYLNKRYYDNYYSGSATQGDTTYTAWNRDNLYVANAKPDTAYYPSGVEAYVEKRYGYPDFIYAGGQIPENVDIRDNGNNKYSPIYPDDYIYFGQDLTYDIVTGGGEHELHPNVIKKSSGLLVTDESGTRVYRTPAYYQSSEKSNAYFNSYAAFRDTYNSVDIYKSMTALDFTEYQDAQWFTGFDSNGLFYGPVTDFQGLSGYVTRGLTQNMLVYITTDKDPSSILRNYYHKDGDLNFDFGTNTTVDSVSAQDILDVKGHLVLWTNDDGYIAYSDHFLVDKQDFNAPIRYTMPSGRYMWYQRVPDSYVESMDAGWESISLPFTAEYVTTNFKGELTHFYQGSKTGHEYWLRKYTGIDSEDNTKLLFGAPAANGSSKYVGNTFFWTYYYSKNSRLDENADEYQEYYKTGRTYDNYPRYSAGTPYLIGFPGKRFYEFDLSGKWKVTNTATPAPEQVERQYITFASSDNGTVIEVTDVEYNNAKAIVNDNYTYMPTYHTQTLPGTTTYLLNRAGDRFQNNDELSSTVTTTPFRAYITSATSGNAPRRNQTRAGALFIGYAGDSDQLIDTPVDRGLTIYSQNMNIIIESTLETSANVVITTVAGRLLKQITIQPGTRISVPVNSRGVYIVNHRKIAVTK